MKRLTIILAGILCWHLMLAQDTCYFFNMYDRGFGDEAAESVIIDRNGDIVLLTSSSPRPSSSDGVWVVWMNICGDTIRSRYYEMSLGLGGEKPHAIFQNDDGSYTILGQQYDPSQGNGSSFLFNISEQGDSISHHIMSIGNNDWLRCGVDLGNKEYAGAGFYNLGGSNSTVFLFKADSSGTVHWQTDLGAPFYHQVLDMASTPEGGFLISGYTGDTTLPGWQIFLIKTDRIGRLKWRKTYLGLDTYSEAYVEVMPDSTYVLAGRYGTTGDPVYRSIVLHLDTSGTEISRTNLGDGIDYIGVDQFCLTTESELIIPYIEYDSIDGDLAYQKTYKIGASGDVLWHRVHRYPLDRSVPSPRDVMVLPNGDIITVGLIFTRPPQSNTFNNAYVMRMDSCGFTVGDTSVAGFVIDSFTNYQAWFNNTSDQLCSSRWFFGDGDSSIYNNPTHTYADSGYYTVTLMTKAANTRDTVTYTIHVVKDSVPDVVGAIQLSDLSAISVYPNPASEKLFISTPQMLTGANLSLFNLLGERVRSITLQSYTQLDISGLPSGVYIYQIEHSGQSHNGKLIVE